MTVPWPPPALRPDTLGQLYNEAYEKAACEEGLSVEDAHQAACAAVHRHGYDHAARRSVQRDHDSMTCTCHDGRCLKVATKASDLESLVALTVDVPSTFQSGHVHRVGDSGIVVEWLSSDAALVEIRVEDPTLAGDAWYETLELRPTEFQTVEVDK